MIKLTTVIQQIDRRPARVATPAAPLARPRTDTSATYMVNTPVLAM
ncbi:MAG: hypothetical protein ABJA50_12250 [Chloroflexota bacterium]